MKISLRLFLVLMLVLFARITLHADQYTIQWADTLDNVNPTDIAVDGNGNVYITGSSHIDTSYDCITIKYDSLGNMVWADTIINGSANSVTTDQNGNIYVVGVLYSGWYYLAVKYDNMGNIVWVDTLLGGNSYATGVAVNNLGNVFISGRSLIDTIYDYVTIKCDSFGNVIWADTLLNASDDMAQGMAIDNNSNIYITGYCQIGSDTSYFTVKYNSSGNVIWTDTFDNSNGDLAHDIAVDSKGNIYITGSSHIDTTDDFLTVEYDSLGNIIWADTIDNGHDDIAYGITVDDNDNIYVTGYTLTGGTGNILTIKYDSSKNIVWADTLTYGEGVKIATDYRNNIYTVNTHYGVSSSDCLTIKYLNTTEDIAVSAITSPTSGPISPGYHRIIGMVNNLSSAADSFDVYAEVIDTINGWTTIFSDTVSKYLAGNDSTLVVFDSCYYPANSIYLTRVYVNLADADTSNNAYEIYSSTKQYLVLYVEDAEGYGAPSHPDPIWHTPLTNLIDSDSIYWYITTDELQDGPTLEAMENAKLVIWNTYDYYNDQCFTNNDTTNLNDYINSGGKVWLVGQDIVYSMLGSKTNRGNKSTRIIFPWLDKFGVDSVSEDFISDTTMTIQGTGEAAGNPISVHSDFDPNFDGNLYPDIIYPDTSAHAVLLDPDYSSAITGIITNDYTKAFWAADGRGADLTPGGDWEILIGKMLNMFGITHIGIDNKLIEKNRTVKTNLIINKTINTKIEFTYKGSRKADIIVSDINGRIIKRFVSVSPGDKLSFGNNNLTAGVYFISVLNTKVRHKITVIK